jgi:hypothetical protein
MLMSRIPKSRELTDKHVRLTRATTAYEEPAFWERATLFFQKSNASQEQMVTRQGQLNQRKRRRIHGIDHQAEAPFSNA